MTWTERERAFTCTLLILLKYTLLNVDKIRRFLQSKTRRPCVHAVFVRQPQYLSVIAVSGYAVENMVLCYLRRSLKVIGPALLTYHKVCFG